MTRLRVEIVSSVALLALHFLLWAPQSHTAALEAPIVAALVPWAMHHNHGVKTLSLLVLRVGTWRPTDFVINKVSLHWKHL